MAAVTYPIRPVRPAPSRRPVRVAPGTYARRRAAAVLVLAACVLALALAVQVVLGAAGGGPLTAPATSNGLSPIAAQTYVVQPGDTLWTIARRLQPDGDVRPLVHVLKKTVGGAQLQPGDRIALPTP
jgi:nucleoid-associated protein YgaU